MRCESVDWIERNEVDSIEVAPGACLAFVATWTLPAFELTGCYSGSNAHGGDSSTGHVRGLTGTVYPGGRTLCGRYQIRSLGESHPGEDLGHARHLTRARHQRPSAVCRSAQLSRFSQLAGPFRLLRPQSGPTRSLSLCCPAGVRR